MKKKILSFFLRLLIFFVGIILLNLLTFGILTNPKDYAFSHLFLVNLIFGFFKSLLYYEDVLGIPFSPILCILFILAFFINNYLNKDKLENKIISDLVFTLGSILLVCICLLVFGFFITIGELAIRFCYFLLIKCPFDNGWGYLICISNFESYFNNPWGFLEFNDKSYNIISNIISILFFTYFLIISFTRLPNNNNKFFEDKEKTSLAIFTYSLIGLKCTSFLARCFFYLYFLFLLPTVLLWFYPVLLNWVDLKFQGYYTFSGIVFIITFIFAMRKIIKNNNLVEKMNLKEEFKKEILDEFSKEINVMNQKSINQNLILNEINLNIDQIQQNLGWFSMQVNTGNQIWSSENLYVNKFRNGDSIPEVKNKDDWDSAIYNEEPAWCYYNFNSENGKKYGKLYNWYAVNDPRGLAPIGWRLPTIDEWRELINCLRKKLLLNEFILGGFIDYFGEGYFEQIDVIGMWWSSTSISDDNNDLWCASVDKRYNFVLLDNINKGYGLSVRCVRI
jgi:hypothetical protein